MPDVDDFEHVTPDDKLVNPTQDMPYATMESFVFDTLEQHYLESCRWASEDKKYGLFWNGKKIAVRGKTTFNSASSARGALTSWLSYTARLMANAKSGTGDLSEEVKSKIMPGATPAQKMEAFKRELARQVEVKELNLDAKN